MIKAWFLLDDCEALTCIKKDIEELPKKGDTIKILGDARCDYDFTGKVRLIMAVLDENNEIESYNIHVSRRKKSGNIRLRHRF